MFIIQTLVCTLILILNPNHKALNLTLSLNPKALTLNPVTNPICNHSLSIKRASNGGAN